MLGVNAGQRVHLDELGAAVRVAAKIQAPRIPAAQRPPRGQGHRLGFGDHRIFIGAPQRVKHPGLALFLVDIGIDPRLGRAQQVHLDGAQNPGRGPRADDARGELAAGQIRLDDHRLPEGIDQTAADGGEIGWVADDRFGRHALAGPLGHRLDEIGRRKRHRPAIRRRVGHDEIGGGHPGVPDHPFGHALVQRQAHDQGIRKGIGDSIEVEQRRHLRLAADAVHALGDVEDQVPAPARHEGLCEPAAVADAFGPVPQRPEGRRDGDDRIVAVEFRRLFFGKPLRQVFRAKVVRQSDRHGHRSGSPRKAGGATAAPASLMY